MCETNATKNLHKTDKIWKPNAVVLCGHSP